MVRSKPLVLPNRPSQGFDYMEAVNSASSVSTPPNDEPFASSNLGETVIKLNEAVTHVGAGREAAASGKAAAASLYKTEGSEMSPNSDALVNHVSLFNGTLECLVMHLLFTVHSDTRRADQDSYDGGWVSFIWLLP